MDDDSRIDAGRGELVVQPLLSNLRPPRLHVGAVERRHLVDTLSKSTAPLVLVSAPAGYGKTITLVQWLRSTGRPTGWLQLDPSSNDPVVLLTYLLRALGEFTVIDPDVLDWVQVRVPPIRSRVLPALDAALAAARPFLLVLDDAHLVRAETSWQILDFLVDRLPPGAQVAVSTREDPPLPLGRLRAAGMLVEIRAPQLALTRAETSALLRHHGRQSQGDVLDAVQAATEGWAAGVYLILLAWEQATRGDRLPLVHGDERQIADYLTGEVLDRQDRRTRQFLLYTSILERFCAPLCRAITGQEDAHLLLARLARRNLFLTALDDHGEWYRYHQLFAACLRSQLVREAPDEVVRLHRAAAAWHSTHGDAEQAVRHWLAAGDVRPAADLVASSCIALLDAGQTATARRILDLFSDEQVLAHVPLTLAAGWVYGFGNPHFVTRRRRQSLVRAACAMHVDDRPSFDGASSLRSSQAQLRAFLAPDGVTRMLADAELSRELEGRRPADAWYMEACKLCGIALYLAGRPEKAIALLRVEETSDRPGAAGPASEVLAFQALIASDRGDWDLAAELDERAWRCYAEEGTEEEPALTVLLAHARLLARHDEDACAGHLQRVAHFLDEMPNLYPRERLLGAVLLAEVLLERGDLPAAERWSAAAQAVIRTCPDAGMLRPRAERLRLALQERRFGQAVTPAEQRVLDLLPTHLSVNEIGARLFISRNTMKSHMRSLYTKLDVHTRAQAVARARQLGLLGGD